VILVTVGTHHQPFTRLIDALTMLPGDEVVVQYGHSPPPPSVAVAESVAFLAYDDLAARMDAADAVVTHAGVGSILTAMRMGHTPIVVPRRRRLGEHVDDHQIELTRALEETGRVLAVWEVDRLPAALAALPARGQVHASQSAAALHAAVRAACAA
jgi:UDP-N-acetylglucosamine transferase subunit ALG13